MSFLTSDTFIFNKISSENYDLIICCLNNNTPDLSVNGLHREARKGTLNRTRTCFNHYEADDSEPVTFSFDVVKSTGKEISREESIAINQWLLAPTVPVLLEFNDADLPLHYYALCVSIDDVETGGRLIGKHVKFETNSTCAFTPKIQKTYKISREKVLSLVIDTGTMGMCYPRYSIFCQTDSKVTLENENDRRSVTYDFAGILPDDKGVRQIHVDSSYMTVKDRHGCLIPINLLGWNGDYQSPVSSTDSYTSEIYWLRLLEQENRIRITGDCTFIIEYELPRKAGCV